MVREYDPKVDGETLQFEYNQGNNNFIDKQAGSEWDLVGLAVNGTMKEKQLIRMPFDEGFWFEWIAFHHRTEIYATSKN